MKNIVSHAHQTYRATSDDRYDRLKTAAQSAKRNYAVQIALAAEELRRAAGFTRGSAFLPLYELQADYPFVDKRGRPLHGWHSDEVSSSCDLDSLRHARDIFQEADHLEARLPAPKLGEGLTFLLEALMERTERDPKVATLREAADAFDAARIRDERCSPAYLYGALSQFLLLGAHRDRSASGAPNGSIGSDDKNGATREQVTQRQAFYRLEHFIDQTLEHLLSIERDRGNEFSMTGTDLARERENGFEFYFDPEEIVVILQAATEVVAALEQHLDLLPVARAYAGADPEAIRFSGIGASAVIDPDGSNRLTVITGIEFRAAQLARDFTMSTDKFRGTRFVTAPAKRQRSTTRRRGHG